MKIKKNSTVKASSEIFDQPLATACADGNCEAVVANDCKYQAAIDLISAAIESLAEIAKDDEVAKDSIANLGVVLFDLKGNC